MGTGEACVCTVVSKHQGLMPMLLGTECAGVLFCAPHNAAALIVEAEGGEHQCGRFAAGFHGGGTFFLVPDVSGSGGALRQEARRNGAPTVRGEPRYPKSRLDAQCPEQRPGQPLSTHPGPAQYTPAGFPG